MKYLLGPGRTCSDIRREPHCANTSFPVGHSQIEAVPVSLLCLSPFLMGLSSEDPMDDHSMLMDKTNLLDVICFK